MGQIAEIEVGGWTGGNENISYVKFDMQYADKLFGVFHACTAALISGGRGFGLATVPRIVKRRGGRAWATGKVNEGATLYFTLPGKVIEWNISTEPIRIFC